MQAKAVIEAAQRAGIMITTAESCTGGGVASALTEIAGASAVFGYGFVTYSNAAKCKLLSVQDATLAEHGAVSEPVAREMVIGASATSGADLGLSITGIAGPGGSEFKPEGRVCFGLSYKGKITTKTVDFGALGRKHVRVAATDHGMGLLLTALHGIKS
ncbi:MAG: CinA family protein [Halocynthiibacter sp.]